LTPIHDSVKSAERFSAVHPGIRGNDPAFDAIKFHPNIARDKMQFRLVKARKGTENNRRNCLSRTLFITGALRSLPIYVETRSRKTDNEALSTDFLTLHEVFLPQKLFDCLAVLKICRPRSLNCGKSSS
jgi:hypothetical protein